MSPVYDASARPIARWLYRRRMRRRCMRLFFFKQKTAYEMIGRLDVTSSLPIISYAVFCLKKNKRIHLLRIRRRYSHLAIGRAEASYTGDMPAPLKRRQ